MSFSDPIDHAGLLRRRAEEQPGGPRVALCGEIDLSSGPPLEAALRRLAAERSGDLTISMAQVSFIDSSGLRVLLALRSELAAQGRRLVLTELSPMARRVIAINLGEDALRLPQPGGLTDSVADSNDPRPGQASMADEPPPRTAAELITELSRLYREDRTERYAPCTTPRGGSPPRPAALRHSDRTRRSPPSAGRFATSSTRRRWRAIGRYR